MPLSEKNLRNSIVYVIPRFANYGLYLLTLPILVRFLTPEDFGIAALALAFPTIATGILTMGLVNSVARYFFEYRTDHKKLNSLYFSTQVYLYAMLVVSSFAVYLGREYISKLIIGKPDYGMAVFVSYLATYLNKINTLYQRIYQNMERAALHSSFVFLEALGGITVSLLLIGYFNMSYMGLVYGPLAGAFVSWVPMSVHFNRRVRIRFDKDILIKNIRYGLQVMPKTLTGFINKFFDKYMLNAMVSASTAGIYNIGQRLSNIFFVLMAGVWQAFQPAYYRVVFDKEERAPEVVGRIYSIFAYITLFPIILGVLFAQEVVHAFCPSSYHGAVDIIIILAAGVATQTLGMYTSIQYAYSKRPFWIFPVTVIGTAINVILNIYLIPRYGLIGAGLATTGSVAGGNFILAYIGQRLYRIEYEWKAIVSLFINIIVAIAAIVYLRAIDLSYVFLYIIKAGLLLAYICIGICFKIITPDSLNMGVSAIFRCFRTERA